MLSELEDAVETIEVAGWLTERDHDKAREIYIADFVVLEHAIRKSINAGLTDHPVVRNWIINQRAFGDLAASPRLMRLDVTMVAIEEHCGQKPWPQEWHDLNHEWNLTLDKIIAAKFNELGEPGMAIIYASDRCEFYRRYENGRRLVSQYQRNAA